MICNELKELIGDDQDLLDQIKDEMKLCNHKYLMIDADSKDFCSSAKPVYLSENHKYWLAEDMPSDICTLETCSAKFENEMIGLAWELDNGSFYQIETVMAMQRMAGQEPECDPTLVEILGGRERASDLAKRMEASGYNYVVTDSGDKSLYAADIVGGVWLDKDVGAWASCGKRVREWAVVDMCLGESFDDTYAWELVDGKLVLIEEED